MNPRAVYFLVTLALFLVALVAVAIYYLHSRHRKRSTYGNWKSLLERITAVDRSSVELIALNLIDESGHLKSGGDSSNLEPSRIWNLIGGLEGLEVLEHNCAALVDLAFYVQQWYPEALVVAEHLRRNAREIEWHIGRLKGAERTGKLETFFPEYAQRAIATYYLMTRHVLDLYERGNLPGLADLQKAL